MSSATLNDGPSLTSLDGEKTDVGRAPSKKGLKFWLAFASLCTCIFLAALEISSVSTALPTITNDLHGSQFTWFGTAYSLAGAVFHPMSGGLAQAYGRKPALLIILSLFALGSGICGGASSMNMLIAGRTVQGLGGGGIYTLGNIIMADITTLQERGLYMGLYWFTGCVAAVVGPYAGGSLASMNWRWLFYLNLPISVLACVAVFFSLDLPTPEGSSKEKFMRLDWVGNFLVTSSTVACTLGLTWGGITAPWGSAKVLVALILGSVGFAVFIAYEAIYAKHPLVPFSLMANLTSLSGYMQVFFSSIIFVAIIYFGPVYFQACKGASPVMTGVHMFSVSSLAPSALVTGITVQFFKRYRPQLWSGWVAAIVGFGLASTLLATDPFSKSIGFFMIVGLGVGILDSACMFPILAPLSVTQNAAALSFMLYVQAFGMVLGIAIGGSVLQNELAKTLPATFIQSVPEGSAIAYALIPELSSLDPQTRTEVQVAFAKSLAALWQVLAGISSLGFVASFFMKGLPLPDELDGDWAMKNEGEEKVC